LESFHLFTKIVDISTVPKEAREANPELAANVGTKKEARAVPSSTVVDSVLAYGPITTTV